MTACSDRGVAMRFSEKKEPTSTMLRAATGAEICGFLMREGKRYPCKHDRNDMTTRMDCRRRFLADDPLCRQGNTPCALGQLMATEAA